MDVKNLMDKAGHLSDSEFEQKLNKLVRDNYRYRNLDEKNREVVKDLVKKYKDNLRKGIGIGHSQQQEEMYRLNRKKEDLGLTKEDLKDIKEIMNEFKK